MITLIGNTTTDLVARTSYALTRGGEATRGAKISLNIGSTMKPMVTLGVQQCHTRISIEPSPYIPHAFDPDDRYYYESK